MAEHQGWQPPFEPIAFPALFQRLYDEGWPAKVILHPVDFMWCARGLGVQVAVDPKLGVSFFYICNTRVEPAAPAVDADGQPLTLDLSVHRTRRIVSPVG